jgi:FkbM family methyltransferase
MAIVSSTIGKVARVPLRLLPEELALPVLSGPMRGMQWCVGAGRLACWFGTYENALQSAMCAHLKAGAIFYDIGANVGFYSLLAARRVGAGKAYAFEPLPANVVYLRRHLRLNGVRNVMVLESAICDADGLAAFREEEGERAMGRLGPDGGLSVTANSLDALLRDGEIEPPDVMKMDIEGAELRALHGAKSCFARFRPTLFLATHGSALYRECWNLLRSWGYSIEVISGNEVGANLLAQPDPLG